MDTVYTCICGSQFWAIHSDYIECGGCGKHYQIELVETPERFNKRIKERREKNE